MPTSPHDWSERAHELSGLLARAGVGDRTAFAALYEKTSGLLFGVVLRIQRDRGQAEDVLQEVYVNVWRAARSFDAAQSQPLTWMTSIARNRAIDSLRRAQTQPQTLDTGATDDDDGGGSGTYDQIADESAGPLELLTRASDARSLGDCMGHLSAPQRQSVALAFYDGLSHAEVAERMRQPLGTVKSWVRRALLSLKNCLERAVEREQRAESDMDYSRPTLAERLAADYVAGTLRGPARRRFEALLPAHPALRAAVRRWQAMLMPLTRSVEPEAPPPRVWQRIEKQLFPPAQRAPEPAWWQRLGFWRGVSALAGIAVLALVVRVAAPPPADGPPIVVVLDAQAPVPGATPATFVASISGDGRTVTTRPLVNVAVQDNRVLELWAAAGSGAPRSLGLISNAQSTVVRQASLPPGTDHLAVSLEPPGGSPTGAPTGPVLYVGRLTP